MPLFAMPAPVRCLVVLVLSGPVAVTAQAAPVRSSPWSVTAFGGLSQHLGSNRLHSAIGLGAGVRHRLGQSAGISAEAAYLPLGSRRSSSPYESIFNPELRGTQSLYHGRKVLRLGLNLDLPLTDGAVRPSLLFGIALARLYSKRHDTIVDSTGTVLTESRFDEWVSGAGAHAGAAIVLPALGPFTPALESRVYGFAFQDEFSWDILPVLTAGVHLSF
jgi:hypothetical protein